MVVAARQGSGWPILDNSNMARVPDVDASSVYLPLFVLDDTGARRYVLSTLSGYPLTGAATLGVLPNREQLTLSGIVRKI